MPKFSLSTVLSAIFLAYIAHSIYSLVSIFIPPKCHDKFCMTSYLVQKPQLQLIIGTTTKSSIKAISDLTLVDRWTPFEYTSESITK